MTNRYGKPWRTVVQFPFNADLAARLLALFQSALPRRFTIERVEGATFYQRGSVFCLGEALTQPYDALEHLIARAILAPHQDSTYFHITRWLDRAAQPFPPQLRVVARSLYECIESARIQSLWTRSYPGTALPHNPTAPPWPADWQPTINLACARVRDKAPRASWHMLRWCFARLGEIGLRSLRGLPDEGPEHWLECTPSEIWEGVRAVWPEDVTPFSSYQPLFRPEGGVQHQPVEMIAVRDNVALETILHQEAVKDDPSLPELPEVLRAPGLHARHASITVTGKPPVLPAPDRALAAELRESFLRRRTQRASALHHHGTRVDLAAVLRRRATREDLPVFIETARSTPLHLHVVLDRSASMHASSMELLRLVSTLRAALEDTPVRVSLLAFNSDREDCARITDQPAELPCDGGTPLHIALDVLGQQLRLEPQAEHSVLVLTDGEPDSNQDSAHELRRAVHDAVRTVRSTGTPLYAMLLPCMTPQGAVYRSSGKHQDWMWGPGAWTKCEIAQAPATLLELARSRIARYFTR